MFATKLHANPRDLCPCNCSAMADQERKLEEEKYEIPAKDYTYCKLSGSAPHAQCCMAGP